MYIAPGPVQDIHVNPLPHLFAVQRTVPVRDHIACRLFPTGDGMGKKPLKFMTPYLILDGETETALKYAAERGVEVALVLPGIPDKRIPYGWARNR